MNNDFLGFVQMVKEENVAEKYKRKSDLGAVHLWREDLPAEIKAILNDIWKILGCCCNTKRHCRNAPYCRNIAAIPCNGHCRNVAATLQLQLHCRSIAAILCCCNIAAMGPLLQYAVRIAAIRNTSTHCRNIAAMTCCRNVAAMPSGITDYLKAPGPFAHFAVLP